ncbi:latent-transforming growth factor beta-binding protein 1-like [Protopterus annectens]|uniref:latent-transforming growth factor beta-binding protein 1-like n=1 Tax=Protopterus annectens TaxID=7888 RepID=UPI001CFA171E|nr:latent-transforming growth factor beta-binding protein 1-like [Protopterus annectens]
MATCKNTEGSFLCICSHEKEEFDPITGKCNHPTQTDVQISTSRTRDSRVFESSTNSSDCYYHINDISVCTNILARNISREVCCCTAGQGWGANCQVQPCPVPGSDEYQHLCPGGTGSILTGRGAFATYTDADECKLFHPTLCKGGICVNHLSGYSCYCPTGSYYNSLLLECKGNETASITIIIACTVNLLKETRLTNNVVTV